MCIGNASRLVMVKCYYHNSDEYIAAGRVASNSWLSVAGLLVSITREHSMLGIFFSPKTNLAEQIGDTALIIGNSNILSFSINANCDCSTGVVILI